MLKHRIATAAVGIPLGLLIVYVGEYAFSLLVLIFVLVGLHELFAVAAKRGFQPNRDIATAGAVLLVLGVGVCRHAAPYDILGLTLALVALGSMVRELWKPGSPHIANTAVTLFGFGYVAWLFCYLLLLRRIAGVAWVTAGHEVPLGFGLVLYALAATWGCDTLAYFTGRLLGKHPLAPKVSPKKTIEGGLGGIAGAVLGSAIVGCAMGWSAAHILILGAGMGVFGQVGDLSKSLLKREVEVKDFGTLFPGHGGVLDRFDAILFNAPLVFYYVRFVMGLDLG